MNLIYTILKINGARFYEVWGAKETTNPTAGSKIKTYEYLTQVYGAIQETGNIKGLTLQATQNSGDTKRSDAILYSAERRNLKERIFYKKLFYEIRGVQDFDNGILKYFKHHLVKVDKQ